MKHVLHRQFLDKDKSNEMFSTQCTMVAANHSYWCACPSCYIHWIHIIGPAEYEDSEFGPFGKEAIENGKRYLGLPLVIETKCAVCGTPVMTYENQKRPLCEDCWMAEQDKHIDNRDPMTGQPW